MNHKIKIGKFGENLASSYLEKKGYKIIKNNFRIGHKEIDILAYFREKIIFIEVKTRLGADFGEVLEAINGKKLKTLKKAIYNYSLINNIDQETLDLEIVFILLEKTKKIAKIKHYKTLL